MKKYIYIKNTLYNLLALSIILSTASHAFAGNCPDITGNYRASEISTSMSPAINGVLEAMKLNGSILKDSEIKISNSNSKISFWVKDSKNEAFSSIPKITLSSPDDFECYDNAIYFKSRHKAGRRLESLYLQGSYKIKIAKHSSKGLTISSEFTGYEQISIYHYDSANISLNKPGTKQVVRDTLFFPDFFENNEDKNMTIKFSEHQDIENVRRLLNPSIMENILIAWVDRKKDEVVVSLNIPKEKDIKLLEERLIKAKIDYKIKSLPIWNERSYHMEIIVKPDPLPSYSTTVKK